MCTARAQWPAPFTQAHLRLPADVLERLRYLLQSPLEVATHVRRIPGRPGSFDEGPAGMAVTRLGDGPLPTALAAGVCRGGQAQVAHELSGVVEARQGAQCSHKSHGDRELHAPEGVQGVDHRCQSPGVDLVLECMVEALEALSVRGHRPDILLEDELLRWGRTAHCTEPTPVGGAPGGSACIANIVAQQAGFAAQLGGLQIPEGIFASPAQLADGCIFHVGDIDGGEITGAPQARQLHRITTVGFHAVARFVGHEGGGDDPAARAFFRQIALEPVAAGACFLDADPLLGLGWQLADEGVNVALACADGPAGDDLGTVRLSDRGHGNGLFMDSEADVQRARLRHG
jgi:hypothetical protein